MHHQQYLKQQRTIQNIMKCLLYIKSQRPRSKKTSQILLNLFECQILIILILPTLNQFYTKFITSLFGIFQAPPANIYIGILIIHLIVLLLLLLGFVVKVDNLIANIAIISCSQIVKYYSYILLVPFLYQSLNLCNKNGQELGAMMKFSAIAIITIGFILGISQEISNWSRRFIEKDFCNRIRPNYLNFILIYIGIYVTLNFGPTYGCICYAVRSIYLLIGRFQTYQYPLRQKIQVFYSILTLFMINWVIAVQLSQSKSQEISFEIFTYVLILSVLASLKITNTLTKYINFKRLVKYPTLTQNQIQVEQGFLYTKQKRLTEFQNNLRLSIQVYQQSLLMLNNKPNNFDLSWKQLTQRIIAHKIKCTHTKCQCKGKKKQSGENQNQNQIFLNDLIGELSKFQIQSNDTKKMKLLSIYLFNEISKKPLKAYYQLMKLKKEKVDTCMAIDLQCLINQTRECFDIIFKKNKVQNQQLELLKVIQYQQFMGRLQTSLIQIIGQILNFLQLFTFSSVKVSSVESQSIKIQKHKEQIQKLLQIMVENYTQNTNNVLFIYVFYKYINPYKSRQAQLKKISQHQTMKKRIYNKSEVNVFSAEHGSIAIDLVESRGKILKLTKNLTEVFGYSREDMVSFNINRFMPKIYGKHHAKFLSNFIEKGKIKLLKEKQRFLFGKNKSMFIFPVNVRLKTEHLLENQFGASALITPLSISSEFIIVGVNGKIQQITQKAYNLLFRGIFKDEVAKVGRLSMYKLLPGMNAKTETENGFNKMYEGLLIFTDFQDTLNQKFKHIRENVIVGNKINTSSFNLQTLSENINSTSPSFTNNSSMSLTDHTVQLRESRIQLLKSFLIDINIFRLKGAKVTYKVSKIKTAQFELQLVELSSITIVPQNKHFFQQVVKQLKEIAILFKFDDQLNPISLYLKQLQMICKDYLNFSTLACFKTLKGIDEKVFIKSKSISIVDSDFTDQHNNHDNLNNKTYKQLGSIVPDNDGNSTSILQEDEQKLKKYNNSDQSSVVGSTQTQSKINILINAFNNKESGIPFCISFITIFIIILLSLLLICLSVFILMQTTESSKQWKDNQYLLTVKQIFQYRASLDHIKSFATLNNSTDFQSLERNKDLLQQLLTQKLKLIESQTNSKELGNHFYEKNITVIDYMYLTETEYTISQLLNFLLWAFKNGDKRSIETLQYNYQHIHRQFQKIIELEIDNINSNHIFFRNVLNSLVGVYEGCLFLLGLISIPIYNNFKGKQKFLLGLLAFMSLKEIKKSLDKLKILKENMKISKENQRSNKIRSQMEFNAKANKQQEQKEQTHTGLKNIKLLQEESNKKNVLLNPYLYLVLILFIFVFSSLSLTLFFLANHTSYYLTQSVQANHIFYNLQNKAPLLVNVYLKQINSNLTANPTFNFLNQTFEQTTNDYFEMTKKLSQKSLGSNVLTENLHKQITQKICQKINCSNIEPSRPFLYLIMVLNLKLSYWKPSYKFTINNTQIQQWKTLNYIPNQLLWVQKLLQFSLIVNQQTQSLFNSYHKHLEQIIIILTTILIPSFTILLFYIQFKFLKSLTKVLRSAEDIYTNFNASILVQNTYLTSYFNAKVKQNK